MSERTAELAAGGRDAFRCRVGTDQYGMNPGDPKRSIDSMWSSG